MNIWKNCCPYRCGIHKMQIVIEHWDEIKLESHKKNKNAPLIQALTGIENYKGRADQRHDLFSKITLDNYQEMRKRIKKLPQDDSIIGSSNFGKFLEHFSSDGDKWIRQINDVIEK